MLQLDAANIQVGAQAATKEDAIRQVAALLVRSGYIEPGYAESMLAREKSPTPTSATASPSPTGCPGTGS